MADRWQNVCATLRLALGLVYPIREFWAICDSNISTKKFWISHYSEMLTSQHSAFVWVKIDQLIFLNALFTVCMSIYFYMTLYITYAYIRFLIYVDSCIFILFLILNFSLLSLSLSLSLSLWSLLTLATGLSTYFQWVC